MKGLSKSQLHQVRESLELATFCRKWWKQLRKEMNRFSLPYTSKQMVLVKISKGLLDEAKDLCENNEDELWLKAYIEEIFKND